MPPAASPLDASPPPASPVPASPAPASPAPASPACGTGVALAQRVSAFVIIRCARGSTVLGLPEAKSSSAHENAIDPSATTSAPDAAL